MAPSHARSSDSRASDRDRGTVSRRRRPPAWVVASIAGAIVILAAGGPWFLTAWLEQRRELRALEHVITVVSGGETVGTRGHGIEFCTATLGDLVRRHPSSPDVFAALARFHGRFGRADDCARCWRRCIDLDPLSAAMAHQEIGSRALADGDFAAAAVEFQASLDAKPGVFDAQINLAESLLGSGAPQAALRVLDQAIGQHGRSLPALALTGQAWLQLRRYAEARAAFEGAIELGPTYPAAHHGLAMAAARLGDEDTAARYRESFGVLQREKEQRHRTALAANDDDRDLAEAYARTHVDAARVCFAHGDAEEGLRLLLEALALSATEPSCRLLLARIHEQRGSPSLALAAFRQAAEVGEDDTMHSLAVAAGLARLGALDDAVRLHQRLRERNPGDAAVHAALAQMLLQSHRDPAEAERAARRAVDLKPSAAYWALLAEACDRGERLGDAVSAARRAVELEPGRDAWHRLLDRLLHR